MKPKYETAEELYQDIKNHLIKDGYISDKSKETLSVTDFADKCRECGRIGSTAVTLSKDNNEWYCHYVTCDVCGTEFMSSTAKFCPGCGRKIIEKR